MDYFDLNNHLKEIFNLEKETICSNELSVSIHNYPFNSSAELDSTEFGFDAIEQKVSESGIKFSDVDVKENNSFKYIIVKDSKTKRAKNVIFLFHGLNERHWQKYLPWAIRLHQLTGKAVILFPIAFHMNRAPLKWSDPRVMKTISNKRVNNYKNIKNSTFANAALSERLHQNPSRFFTSGFQTFSDVTDVVENIREGKHELIYDDASIDFFGYSIGALLAEVLLMANPHNNFDNSKLFIFCGGPTFDIMFPVAKAILDSEAYEATSKFFKLFDDYLNKGKINRTELPAIKYFKSLLSQYGLRDVREDRLQELKDKIFAVSLIKDKVVPPESVINTLNGVNKKIPIRTMIADFPYDYSHEVPFPTNKSIREIVDVNFKNTFELAATYLN